MSNRNNANRAANTETAAVETAPVVVQAPTVETAAPVAVAKAQAPALRLDTKIAARTAAATAALPVGPVQAGFADTAALSQCAVGSVRAAAKGTLYVSPLSAFVALGNCAASAKAPQHQLAVSALRAVLETGAQPATGAACLRAVQARYVAMGGTDLSIFTGRTRLYSNGGKGAVVQGTPQGCLTVYNPPVA